MKAKAKTLHLPEKQHGANSSRISAYLNNFLRNPSTP